MGLFGKLLAERFFMSNASDNTEGKQERLKTKAFWIAFEMVFVFGLPAAGAVLVSRWQGWAGAGLYISLAAAFVLSWVITIMRVRALADDMKQLKKEASDTEGGDSKDTES